eukprot:6179452-Pleurochrysis_carterae.AAC.3
MHIEHHGNGMSKRSNHKCRLDGCRTVLLTFHVTPSRAHVALSTHAAPARLFPWAASVSDVHADAALQNCEDGLQISEYAFAGCNQSIENWTFLRHGMWTFLRTLPQLQVFVNQYVSR